MPKRILIADDHFLVRGLMKSVFAECTWAEVCGEAADGCDAVEKARLLRPDVVVLDLCMPGMNGFAVADAIHEASPKTPVILFSEYKDAISPERAKIAGLAALCAKSEGLEQLVREVQRVT